LQQAGSAVGAKSGAARAEIRLSDAQAGPVDPDLATVISAWPTLPEASKQSILATIREAHSEPGRDT